MSLKIAGRDRRSAAVTQIVISGPLSPDAVQGIGQRHASQRAGAKVAYEWHMVIDLANCIGCGYCVHACQAVNDVPEDEMRWNIVFPERTEAGRSISI